jgi:hypothetical protein
LFADGGVEPRGDGPCSWRSSDDGAFRTTRFFAGLGFLGFW